MRASSTVLLVLLALPAFAATDPVAELIGTWKGTSLCTGVRAACHDETVVYHVTRAGGDRVAIAMNKIVDGEEQNMGTIEFQAAAKSRRLTATYDSGRVKSRWAFQWTANELRGTAADVPSGRIVRNIVLRR
ncbi:MAG TPA: hypothetical protein VN181_00290 [Thermoanaerobaculia bacterium]|nr:hypothetical protein [Thermoanaerobaculia bacterium]